MSPSLTRRALVLASAGALVAAPLIGRRAHTPRADNPRRAYEALVAALAEAGALPDAPGGASSAADRLDALYADALPARRREIDHVLEALAEARLSRRSPQARLRLLRDWTAAGGERRALAARATALAAAAYGPADRALPVVI